MKRQGVFGLSGVLVGSAVFAAWLGGCYNASGSDLPAVIGDQSADGAVDTGASSTDGCCAGLPCNVNQLLVTNCQSCHSAHPSAPMPLVTYDDLQAPSRSDATKKVYELALERMSSAAKPMPASGQLPADQIALFSAWVSAGAPKSVCTTSADSGVGAECTMASDCPGILVCRAGTCDVECISDKDCTVTWSCEDTRCQPPVATTSPYYNAVTTTSAWSTMSLTSLTTDSYSGTAFDGRFVYFAPRSTGPVMRYDTQVGFTSARAWDAFDLKTVDPNAQVYSGTAFDGRYVYFIPSGGGAMLARFDTQGLYGDPASWTTFDLHAVSSSVGFVGATFDGRYLYLVPASSAVTFRYDTAAPVTSVTSWSTFTISSVNAAASSFVGAVSTGRYMYFVPNGGAGPRGVVARYDAEAPFASATSWATLDISVFNAAAKGYRTGAFDGRYLYLVPGWTAPSPSWATSTIARYDTLGVFTTSASWTFFDTSTVDPHAVGFNAAAFDGEHLILAPGYNGTAYHGMTLSFDTKSDLKTPTAWSVFDMTTLAGAPRNLRGESFDGRYVYYAPASGIAARFDARPFAAGAGLTSVGGSFY